MRSKIVNNSILPTIMKKIREYFVKKPKLLKFKLSKPYIEEFTVFIKVNIDNLNELIKSIPLKVNNDAKVNKDKINTITDKKYLLISLRLKLILVKISLFINTFFGLLNDKIWFKENFKSE